MTFTVSSADLLKGLSMVAKALPAKPSSPILENFLFDIKDTTLTITASDGDITMTTVVSLENSDEDTRIVMRSKFLLELLKELPDQPVYFKILNEEFFECKWTGGESTLPYYKAAEYPEISKIEDDSENLTFPAQLIVDGLTYTVNAIEEDPNRPVMNGVLFDVTPEGSTLVATDSRKLVCYTTTQVKAEDACGFILHKKAATILKNIIDKDAETIDIKYDSKKAIFQFGQTTMICRLIIGKYPKYRSVIPQNNSNVLTVSKDALLSAVRRLDICSSHAGKSIKFSINGSSLEVFVQDLSFNISAHEKMECKYSGEDMEIGFYSEMLLGILADLPGEELQFKISDPKKAVLVIPVDDENSTEKICCILVPAQV